MLAKGNMIGHKQKGEKYRRRMQEHAEGEGGNREEDEVLLQTCYRVLYYYGDFPVSPFFQGGKQRQSERKKEKRGRDKERRKRLPRSQ